MNPRHNKWAALTLALAILLTGAEVLAQRNITPGLPFTYVVEDSIPDYARGPAWDSLEHRIRTYHARLDQRYNEIRYIYRIHCHPDLASITDQDSSTVQVPRNPGESELITLGRAGKYKDVVTVGNHTYEAGWVVSGFQTRQRPELTGATMLLSESDDTAAQPPSPDTTYWGFLKFFPEYYSIKGGLRGSDGEAYAYLVQFVDSVWAPRIVSTAEVSPPELMLTAYPNPAREQVTVELPDDWATLPLSVRVYDPEGHLLARSYEAAARLHHLHLDAAWPNGLYHIAFYRDGGRVAVARVMKAP